MNDYYVYVNGVIIGTVSEECEEFARCAALSDFSREDNRSGSKAKVIFDDDEFTVRKI